MQGHWAGKQVCSAASKQGWQQASLECGSVRGGARAVVGLVPPYNQERVTSYIGTTFREEITQ